MDKENRTKNAVEDKLKDYIDGPYRIAALTMASNLSFSLDNDTMYEVFTDILKTTEINEETKEALADIYTECQMPRLNMKERMLKNYSDKTIEFVDKLGKEAAKRTAMKLCDDKDEQKAYERMYLKIHNSHTPKQGDSEAYKDAADYRKSIFYSELDAMEAKASAEAFVKLVKNDDMVKGLLMGIKPGSQIDNLNHVMSSRDCNFYDLINEYEANGAERYIYEQLQDGNKMGLSQSDIDEIWKVEELIQISDRLDEIEFTMVDYISGFIPKEEADATLSGYEPEFLANAFAETVGPFIKPDIYITDSFEKSQKLSEIYKICDFDGKNKEAIDKIIDAGNASAIINAKNAAIANDIVKNWLEPGVTQSTKWQNQNVEGLLNDIENLKDRRNYANIKSAFDLAKDAMRKNVTLDGNISNLQKIADFCVETGTKLNEVFDREVLDERNPENELYNMDMSIKLNDIYSKAIKDFISNNIESQLKSPLYSMEGSNHKNYGLTIRDEAEIMANVINSMENSRIMGTLSISQHDMELRLADACNALGLTDDEAIDIFQDEVDCRFPQINNLTEDIIKIGVMKDMINEYVRGGSPSALEDIGMIKDDIDKTTFMDLVRTAQNDISKDPYMETLTERRDDLFNLVRDDKNTEKDMRQNIEDIEEVEDIKSDFSSNEEEDIDDMEWGD